LEFQIDAKKINLFSLKNLIMVKNPLYLKGCFVFYFHPINIKNGKNLKDFYKIHSDVS